MDVSLFIYLLTYLLTYLQCIFFLNHVLDGQKDPRDSDGRQSEPYNKNMHCNIIIIIITEIFRVA